MREGLASLLERGGYEVIGQAGDGSELMRLVRELRPDLAVVDIRMPPDHRTEGLEAARMIREEFPDTAILILSAHVEVTEAMTLLATGRGSGYLLKSRISELDDFLDAVARISRGGSVVDPALIQELIGARDVHDALADLTRREREVLALMAEGYSNAGIGRRTLRHREHGREARAQHHEEAPRAGHRRCPSPRARRDHVPRRAIVRLTSPQLGPV